MKVLRQLLRLLKIIKVFVNIVSGTTQMPGPDTCSPAWEYIGKVLPHFFVPIPKTFLYFEQCDWEAEMKLDIILIGFFTIYFITADAWKLMATSLVKTITKTWWPSVMTISNLDAMLTSFALQFYFFLRSKLVLFLLRESLPKTKNVASRNDRRAIFDQAKQGPKYLRDRRHQNWSRDQRIFRRVQMIWTEIHFRKEILNAFRVFCNVSFHIQEPYGQSIQSNKNVLQAVS